MLNARDRDDAGADRNDAGAGQNDAGAGQNDRTESRDDRAQSRNDTGEGREDFDDLERFVQAQDAGMTFAHAVAELRRGRKTSHWMWFVFPQIAGLGQSPMSKKFALSSLSQARAYLRHPVLGPRLIDCATIVAQLQDRSAEQIFGEIDAQKLRSSMTLFARAAAEEAVFAQVLDRYFGGIADPATDQRLQTTRGNHAVRQAN
ncbi:DUF1810 domain-containing protein [Jatrophihabitans sp.]|jgi:uncharacterized protein (DUF1810 family)|uniref:DUF1810 domain-containing protein n=1 Tax=Jatrophihabitans sp. TaxID=1932789 RepID=UPI002F1255F4